MLPVRHLAGSIIEIMLQKDKQDFPKSHILAILLNFEVWIC